MCHRCCYTHRFLGAAGIVLLLAAPPAAAQERHTMADYRAAERAAAVMAAGPTAPAVPQTRTRRTPNPVVWGLAGGAVGVVVGGVAGWWVGGKDSSFLMGLAGMSLGIPLGVHLAYGADGPYVVTALLSVGVALAGERMSYHFLGGPRARTLAPLVATPVVQLAASTYIEHRYWEYAQEQRADPDADEGDAARTLRTRARLAPGHRDPRRRHGQARHPAAGAHPGTGRRRRARGPGLPGPVHGGPGVGRKL